MAGNSSANLPLNELLEVVIQGESLSDFAENPLITLLFCLALALGPFLMLSLTSFVKLSVVFGILRNALGAGQIPSAAISGLLSLVLTLHIMAPVARQSLDLVTEEIARVETTVPLAPSGKSSPRQLAATSLAVSNLALRLITAAAKPFRAFLTKHSRSEERVFFAQLARLRELPKQSLPGKESESSFEALLVVENPCSKANVTEGEVPSCEIPGESLFTLVPAFVISELREAFAIGFTIFLPFLVIDLVIANLLVGLGMMMVSPVSISLPFKILLFVVCDGWFLLVRGLVLGYL